jgi:hypothetical protein
MATEERKKNEHGYTRLKAIQHIAMGIVYFILAGVMFYLKKFGAIELGTWMAYSLGSILVLYGGFRIWRGIVELKMIRNED